MNRTILTAFLLMLAAVGVAAAADKPDFSGEWKMNPAKSDYAGIPLPTTFSRTITHVDPALTIVEVQTGGAMGDSNTTRKMTTDGKTVKNDAPTGTLSCTAVWDGTAIVADTVVDGAGLAFKDKMSLSDDHKVLTSKVLVNSQQGDVELTIVFDKQ